MSDHTEGETIGGTENESGCRSDGRVVEGVGIYEADGAVVFYDTENPLAWVQTGEAIPLEEAV